MGVIQSPRPLNRAGAEYERAAAMTIEGKTVRRLLSGGKLFP